MKERRHELTTERGTKRRRRKDTKREGHGMTNGLNTTGLKVNEGWKKEETNWRRKDAMIWRRQSKVTKGRRKDERENKKTKGKVTEERGVNKKRKGQSYKGTRERTNERTNERYHIEKPYFLTWKSSALRYVSSLDGSTPSGGGFCFSSSKLYSCLQIEIQTHQFSRARLFESHFYVYQQHTLRVW